MLWRDPGGRHEAGISQHSGWRGSVAAHRARAAKPRDAPRRHSDRSRRRTANSVPACFVGALGVGLEGRRERQHRHSLEPSAASQQTAALGTRAPGAQTGHSSHQPNALIPLQKETSTIPIVFISVSDPLGQGIVKSLARPTGNLTGFSNLEFSLVGKWLQILQGGGAAPHGRLDDLYRQRGVASGIRCSTRWRRPLASNQSPRRSTGPTSSGL